MKRGINSIDAFIAIMLSIVIVFILQSYFNLNLDAAKEYGPQLSLKTEAVRVGSAMNSFYAIDPLVGDYLVISSSLKTFDGDVTPIVTKSKDLTIMTVVANLGDEQISSTYPVVDCLKYDQITGKVSR